jgi:hypothetical protein
MGRRRPRWLWMIGGLAVVVGVAFVLSSIA